MKKIKIVSLIVFVVASMSSINAQEMYDVAVENSTISWKGYKPTGSHNGTITLQSGSLEMEDGEVIGGSFTADMATIKDADGSARLEGHLKSKDFFEVETFATATFKITNVEIGEGEEATITGDLTIKGITKEISFTAEVSETDAEVTLMSTVFQINRADFNVKYQSKTFFNNLKERFINDDFDLQVTIVVEK